MIHGLKRAIQSTTWWRLVDRVASLEAQNAHQAHLIRHLSEQADALRSRMELPDTLADELAAWRTATPVPAEPLVTVCIGTYNRARLLTERAIPSILAQTYGRLELVVVGDGCTDDTPERVAAIRDPRLTFVNLPERGRYPEAPELRYLVAGTPAVNHALSLARGDYVTHLDDDDEHMPDRLEKLVAFARAQAADFVWHPFLREDDAGGWARVDATEMAWGHVTTSSVFYRSWFTRIPWDVEAYRLREPGDWNRFRKFKYLGAVARRYPEPLLKHYRERNQPEYRAKEKASVG